MTLPWEDGPEGPFVYAKLADGTSLHITVREEGDEDQTPREVAGGVIHHGGQDGWVADGMMFHANGRFSARLRSNPQADEDAAKEAAVAVWEDLEMLAEGVPAGVGSARASDPPEADIATAGADLTNVDVTVVAELVSALGDVLDAVPDHLLGFAMRRFRFMSEWPETRWLPALQAAMAGDISPIADELPADVMARGNALAARFTRISRQLSDVQ